MKARKFAISSLILAGIAPANAEQISSDGLASATNGPDPGEDQIVQMFAMQHGFLLAGHRSHSSHSSHSSHRSGSSGYSRAPVYTPAPVRQPRVTPSPSRNEQSTPPSSILPSSPATAPNRFLSAPTADTITDIVRRVQIGLTAYGYYNGVLDGRVGPETRASLVRFQTDYGIKVTGTITPEVLDAFRIQAG